MMIAKIGITPSPMKSNTPSSIGPLLVRRRGCGRRDELDDEPGAADAAHADDGADGDIDR